MHQDRHHAPREIERNLIELLVLFESCFRVKVRGIENRPVEQVFQARLEIADQVAIQEHIIRFTSGDVAVPHQDDAIFGKGTRLVGAQHVHPAEVLDGVQPLDDYLLAAHGQRAIGKAYRDNHWEHFRSEPYGYGQRKKESALPFVLGETIDEKDQRHHHGHKLHHQPGEAVETLIEARQFSLPGNRLGHTS